MRLAIALLSLLASSILVANAAGTVLPGASSPTNTNKIQTYSPLVTGNGFGYAVLATTGDITRLYAHPYRFERPNSDPSKDGYDTANFLKSMSWSNQAAKTQIGYIQESHVLSAKGSGIENVYFMPFGLKHNVLIALQRGTKSSPQVSLRPVWQRPIEKETQKELQGLKLRLLQFRDIKESLAIVALGKTDSNAKSANSKDLVGQAFAFLVLEDPAQLEPTIKDLLNWRGALSNDALIDREIQTLEKWRIKPTVALANEKEKQLWRQNETIVKMAQIEEENTAQRFNHGLILASLPDGVWFTPWVRDMSYALVGLTIMGHNAEAREGIMSWFNARPIGRWKQDARGMDYQISLTRYYGDGSEECDFSGQKTENAEFDDWGLALWSISEYWQKTHDDSLLAEKTYRGTVYESMRDYIVKPLLGNLDPYRGGLIVAEDSSCWEEHQENKRHYAFSTIAAIPGLKGFQKIAEHMHDDTTAKMVAEKIQALEAGFNAAFVKNGKVQGVLETDTQPKSEADGAILEAFNFDLVNDPGIIQNTLDKLQVLKTASGGWRRNTGPSNYEAHEFLFIDFNLARVLFKTGKTAEASKIVDTMVDKAIEDHGLIPEMYVSEKNKDCPGEIGDPGGAIPMVGYGAGIYAITLNDRARFSSHSK